MTITTDDLEQWSHDLVQLRNYIQHDDFGEAIAQASQIADEAAETAAGIDEGPVAIVEDLREIEKLTVERRWDEAIAELIEVRDAFDETVQIVGKVTDE